MSSQLRSKSSPAIAVGSSRRFGGCESIRSSMSPRFSCEEESLQVLYTTDKFIVTGALCTIAVCRIKGGNDLIVGIGLVAQK